MRTLVASHVCADALRRQPARLRSSPDWISLPMLIHSGISYDAGGGTGEPSGAWSQDSGRPVSGGRADPQDG